jgi:aminoglycoside 6'-N-acetyltransferase
MSESFSALPDQVATDRLILRRYTESDAAMLVQLSRRNDEHLAEYESGNVIVGIQNEQEAGDVIEYMRLSWESGDHYFVALINRESGAWAGQLYVAPTNRDLPEYTIGYVADVDHEGHGYITEAVRAMLGVLFGTLGANRVRSDCNEHNERSWRVLERCGFTREGHLRNNRRYSDGTFHGDYLYGILRDEYEAAGRGAGC